MKALERKYSKLERVVAKGKFSCCNYFITALIALILGGLTAAIWIFKDKIEAVITKTEPATHLTDDVMRWVLLGVGVVVFVSFLIETIKFKSKELVLTPDKVAFREGVLNVRTSTVQLVEIKMVETKQNIFQRLLGVGNLIIVSDAQKPHIVKNVKSPDRLSRKIMKQAAECNKAMRGNGAPMYVRFAGYAK